MHRLVGEVAHYAWGSKEFLPEFLGVAPDGRPWAELWIGTHPTHPSRLEDGRTLAEVAGRLPFLVKVLSAAEPLSIQAHPDSSQAAAGYEAEERANIPVDAAHRSFRDPNGKPELLWALTPVEALCGLRDPAASREFVGQLDLPVLGGLRELLDAGGTDALVRALRWALVDAPATAPEELVAAAVRIPASSRWFPEAQWLARLGTKFPGDRGLLAAMLLNLVRLEAGSALVLQPGVPHAYLHGSGVEVMGASDNVLRGGLTTKHVDVPALLDVLRPAAPSGVVRPRAVSAAVEVLDAHGDSFVVHVARPAGTALKIPLRGPSLLLCVGGQVVIDGQPLPRGRSAYTDVTGDLDVSGSGAVVVVSRS